MSKYKVSKYAVCPYYRWHENNRICCEGTDANNSIHLVFGDTNDMKAYAKCYCNDLRRCEECMLHQMLDLKYPE